MKFTTMWIASILACAFVPSHAFTLVQHPSNYHQQRKQIKFSSALYQSVDSLGSTSIKASTKSSSVTQTRVLGSQELLMLPRQYKPSADKGHEPFPQMSHVSTVVLSATPTMEVLSQAIDEAIASHPLLRCYVKGDGEPTKRIDLFEMVREGEPNPCTFVCPPANEENSFSSKDVLSVIDVDGDDRDALDSSWKSKFASNLDNGSDWCDVKKGPLWKVELHQLGDGKNENLPCALMFTFNHAISDQSSVNMLTDHIVSNIAGLEKNGKILKKAVNNDVPMSMEQSVLGEKKSFSDVQTEDFSLDTVKYIAGKAAEGLRSPVILPDDLNAEDKGDGSGILGALTLISGKAPGGESIVERKSIAQFRSLTKDATSALLGMCRQKGVTISNALSAAIALTSSDFIDNGKKIGKSRNYKVLQSLDMRRFGAALDNCESVSCMAGSHDLMLGPLSDRSGRDIRVSSDAASKKEFWALAKESQKQTADFFDSGGPQQATRVFDFAMTISDMNNLVNLAAKSEDSQGRAYSAGIVNAGVFERQNAVRREGDDNRDTLSTKHGRYEIEEIYFATSHARSGCLYQASCLTLNDQLQCTFHPAMPIVSEAQNAMFADGFIELLEIMAKSSDVNPSISALKKVPVAAASLYGIFGLFSHAGAWSNFYQSVMQMKEGVTDPADFWAALNFWIFFAVGHPLLQPILWISDVLHGTPGPMIADLVPVLFVAGNAAVIYAVSASKEIRNGLNIFALSAFISYVGAGLDGQAGLGDFNLALDDSYAGKTVKGCPTYDEVRQKSMDDFDLAKYQGLWYEHKFHDWTQFKEVYDTTLDIKLTEGGKGWVDDFAVKGPAPNSAPLSWDKSPVADGAHYFMLGRVDEKDPPGVLRESGFGVEFPNYIVDVLKDPETGEYKEAIQFQCLERGGVRVFEGINFMSRNSKMSDAEMNSMHERSKMAGMYPYGASPEQMHTVARRPPGDIDNSWQRMWKAIGVDKLLELLTESIEDGGR
jgi:hypothetical protein